MEFCPELEISKIGNQKRFHFWHVAHTFWVVFVWEYFSLIENEIFCLKRALSLKNFVTEISLGNKYFDQSAARQMFSILSAKKISFKNTIRHSIAKIVPDIQSVITKYVFFWVLEGDVEFVVSGPLIEKICYALSGNLFSYSFYYFLREALKKLVFFRNNSQTGGPPHPSVLLGIDIHKQYKFF